MNSYSWHPGTRGPQVYTLYGADGQAGANAAVYSLDLGEADGNGRGGQGTEQAHGESHRGPLSITRL